MSAAARLGVPIWVVVDRVDAARLPAEALRGRVLAITPVARAALVGKAADLVDPRRHFGDWAQARTVAAVRRARRKLEAAVAALPGADEIHREIALDHFLRAAYTGYRLWFTLGNDGPWMVAAVETWQRSETHEAAYAALLRRMLAPLVKGQARVAQAGTPPLPALYRRLRQSLLRVACRRRAAFVSGARKGMFGLLDAIAGDPARPRLVVVQSTGGGWRDYLRLARGAWRMAAGQRFLDVSLLAPPRGDFGAASDRLIGSLDDPVIAGAFTHYRELLAYRLAQAARAREDARAIVSATSPRHYLSADASRVSDWALAAACGERHVTRWVLSRNTHVAPASRMAEDACRGYFLTRHPPGMVDRFLFWSPHGAAAARAMLPREKHGAVEPIAAVEIGGKRAPAEPRRQRRILVADTFGAFWFPHSWAFQTSDEFLDGLAALIRAVETLPDTTVLVRIKPKHELDLAAYRALLPASAKVEFKARDLPFRDDLLGTDLLVSYRSTTIEEALHARRPVLLWGGTARYRYLAARTAPPSAGDRGTIYAPAGPDDLPAMLSAILDQHAGRPLTDAEIAPHVWPKGTRGIPALAREMLAAPAAASSARRAA